MTLRYRLDVADAHAHLYRVTLSLSQPAAEQALSLPVWVPGSYLVREFSKHLSGLEAHQSSRPVALTQTEKSTWVATCKGTSPLTVSYFVYAFDASVRAAWLDAQRGFFNGSSVFLRAHGHEDRPHELQLGGAGSQWPKGWAVATSLAAVKINAQGCGRYLAANYDELIDHPVELGQFWRGHFTACGIPHEFIVTGALPDFDSERLLTDTQRICEAQIAFWHGSDKNATPPPFDRYVFFLNAVHDGYGGLEHRASTALIASRRDLPHKMQRGLPDSYVTLLGLISHEYFHTWNVKRMRPFEFTRYDYTQENYTELLWFFEGFTSYYDDLFLLRCGLIDTHRYLKLLSKTMTQVQNTPGRHVQSVAQSSFDAWVKYYRPDENTPNATVSYYTKGCLIALALDLTLRHEGKSTLDGVMHTLWRNSRGGPIQESDIAHALAREGQRAYDDELLQWVHGTEELPLSALLQTHNIKLEHDTPTTSQWLGAKLNEQPSGLQVQAVWRQGLAERIGIAPNDELLAFDGWRLRKADDLLRLNAFTQGGSLLIARDQKILTLEFTPGSPPPGAVMLRTEDQNANNVLQKKRRTAWFSGGF